MKMLIYVILHGVYLINEWNAIINLQNDMVKKYPEPNDLYIYIYKNSINFSFEKVGSLHSVTV
jgi:hypothetical protein